VSQTQYSLAHSFLWLLFSIDFLHLLHSWHPPCSVVSKMTWTAINGVCLPAEKNLQIATNKLPMRLKYLMFQNWKLLQTYQPSSSHNVLSNEMQNKTDFQISMHLFFSHCGFSCSLTYVLQCLYCLVSNYDQLLHKQQSPLHGSSPLFNTISW